MRLGANEVAILSRGSETGGAYALLEWTLAPPPATGLQPHRHLREDEAGYVLEGSLEVMMGSRTIGATLGEHFFISRGTYHQLRNVGTGAARVLVILSPAGFEGYVERIAALLAGTESPDEAAVRELQREYGMETELPG
jgi:mannose-6-phosphate isomerase-like protein (cupin superfamily)